MKRFGFLFLLWVLGLQVHAQKEVNIRAFGAVADGKTLNTEAVQAAIDKVHAEGGGRVLIPKGTYLSGSIVLKTGVELHLEKNAVLLGSTNPADYLKLNRWMGLVMADHAQNISITGKGTLDGQGAALALHIDSLFYIGQIDSANYEFPERRPLAPLRPQVIEIVNCTQVLVSGITVKNAACWVQTYDLCKNLTIRGIRVESTAYWNNDGMDIIDCRNVLIEDCYVNASDDGICLKSYAYAKDGTEFCDSIVIQNCTVRSSASAVKFGTASYGGFRNVEVKNIKVFDTFRSAIALEVVNGGFLENVLVENIRATNTGNAIFIRLGNRRAKYEPGTVKNIVIRDVKVKVPYFPPDYSYEMRGPALPFFHNIFPSSVTGIPGHPVQNVSLEDIEIVYPGRGNKAYANLPTWRLEQVPEQITHYPEFSMFGELPAWGFYFRHVEGISMKNVRLRIQKPDYRPCMVLDDVQTFSLREISIEGDEKSGPIYVYKSEGMDTDAPQQIRTP